MTDTGVEPAAPRRALALETDLFFSTKIAATLRHIGLETAITRGLDAFLAQMKAGSAVALVNISARGVDWQTAIHAAHTAGVPVIAYGSHVDTEAQALARAAGATRVIANSRLASDLPGIVERALAASGQPEREALDDGAPASADEHGEGA